MVRLNVSCFWAEGGNCFSLFCILHRTEDYDKNRSTILQEGFDAITLVINIEDLLKNKKFVFWQRNSITPLVCASEFLKIMFAIIRIFIEVFI